MGRWMFWCICGWCVQSWVTKWTLYMKSCQFFCFFSWHSRFGTWFWSRSEQKSGQKSRFRPHKNKKEWKRSRKSEPRLGKQLRKSSGKTSTWHSNGPDQILYSVSSSCLSQVRVHFFAGFHTDFSFTQGLHGEDADPIDAAPVTIFPCFLLCRLRWDPYCDSRIVNGNVSPTCFIVIPRSGKRKLISRSEALLGLFFASSGTRMKIKPTQR